MPETTAEVEIAAKHLDRILSFFSRVESKATFMFAIDSALLGILAINVQKSDFVIWYHAVAIATAALLIGISLYFVYRCIFPSLKGGNSSLIYFREIARMREAEYLTAFKSMSAEALRDDLVSQAWRNSEILTKKFDDVKAAFIFAGLALLPWFVFLALAALTHPQLPMIK